MNRRLFTDKYVQLEKVYQHFYICHRSHLNSFTFNILKTNICISLVYQTSPVLVFSYSDQEPESWKVRVIFVKVPQTFCLKFLSWNRRASKSSGLPLLVTKQFLFEHCSKGSDPIPKPQSFFWNRGVKYRIRLMLGVGGCVGGKVGRGTRIGWYLSMGGGVLNGWREYFESK